MNINGKKLFTLASLLALALPGSFGVAAPKAQLGPHGGRILSDGSRTAEIRIEEKSKLVDVFVAPYKGDEPNALHVTLHDSKNQPVTLVLKAVSGNPSDNGHFQGSLGSSVDQYGVPKTSAMGIEIKIPLSKGEPVILRSKGE